MSLDFPARTGQAGLVLFLAMQIDVGNSQVPIKNKNQGAKKDQIPMEVELSLVR